MKILVIQSVVLSKIDACKDGRGWC